MSLEQWSALLVAIRRYADKLARMGRWNQTTIIWHGGEPLLLPRHYFEQVLQLEKEILSERDFASGRYRNVLQTNLYAIDPAKVDFLHESGFGLGVSMDVASGMRIKANGQATEHQVAQNMDWLRARGIPFGALVVLGAHTADALLDVYAFFEELEVPVRILPLFATPTDVPGAPFGITVDRCISSMKKLFIRWLKAEQRVPVAPFMEYLRTVQLRREAKRQPQVNRRLNEWAIIVNTDGELYQRVDAYDCSRSMGNVFRNTIDSIFDSPEYAASLARDDELYARHCATCRFDGACSRIPLLESKRDHAGKHCSIAFEMCEFIDRHLIENKVSRQFIEKVLSDQRVAH